MEDIIRKTLLCHEHIIFCIVGFMHEDQLTRQMIAKSIQNIAKIKLQMNQKHKISIAMYSGDQIQILQQLTRDGNSLSQAIDQAFRTDYTDNTRKSHLSIQLDYILQELCTTNNQTTLQFTNIDPYNHIIFIYGQSSESVDQLNTISSTGTDLLSIDRNHLDIIYWHHNVPYEVAQNAYNTLAVCGQSNENRKFYILEVGGSMERFHQALVISIAHPLQRLDQLQTMKKLFT